GSRAHPHRRAVHPRRPDGVVGADGIDRRTLRRGTGRRRQGRSGPRAATDRRARPAVRQDRDAVRRRAAHAARRTGRNPLAGPGRSVRRHDEGNLRMNAPAKTMSHPTHKFQLLLKREFWEHKGGFFWAPLVAGGVFLLLSLMGFGVGEMAARRATGNFEMGDGRFQFNGIDLEAFTAQMDAHDLYRLGQGIDLSMMMASTWPLIVLAFVVFFYCLGALYDERKDRSVLFWKSLPLSDRETVLSKVASALLVAPALAVAAAVATMFGFLMVLSAMVLLHGGNPFEMVWGPGSPLKVAGQLVAVIPVYALWALPTAGWLLLCSSWAKSKPFL